MEDKPPKEEKQMYVDAIIELLNVCDDLELLDFILKLLQKNMVR